MRVHVLGGFLGAGKTTLLCALARSLAARGEKVAAITNDQGEDLVDTALCLRAGAQVEEIAGGCFCCRYEALEQALSRAQASGCTVAVAEAVGSCTDLVATVMAPLQDRHPGRFELAPLTVVVEPDRVLELLDGAMPADLAYLFRKQIEEADVVALGRADLESPRRAQARAALARLAPHAAQVDLSGRSGAGIDAWLAARPTRPAQPLVLDYERYAAAEAMLGWYNATAHLEPVESIAPSALIRTLLDQLTDLPIAHLKVTSLAPAGGRASLVRAGAPAVLEIDGLPDRVAALTLRINGRVAMPPDALRAAIEAAMHRAAHGVPVRWEGVQAFRPGRPVPVHRYAARCGPGDEGTCCAALYDRPDVRALLGDSWHPGGVALTLEAASRLGLGPGSRLLDVACGAGTSLAAIRERWSVDAMGVDANPGAHAHEGLRLTRGDVHELPFDDASFDAVLCECAVSTFFDQPRALREIARVLRPGARLALTDMVVEGELPDTLRDWADRGLCLTGALSGAGYVHALASAGLRLVERWDAHDELAALLLRVKRNLVGVAMAQASGQFGALPPIDIARARAVLNDAAQMLTERRLGYGVFIAERIP